MESTKDEPITPAGRLFLQPQINQIINCAISFKNPLHIDAIKTELSSSFLVEHPRFSSLFVTDDQGREFWRKTRINLDDHIIIHGKNQEFDSYPDDLIEEKINSILADFSVSSPLSVDKPLWEIHLINDLKCFIFRIHHALGDGISLMSMIMASCKRLDGKEGEIVEEKIEKRKLKKGVLKNLKGIWYSIIGISEFIGRVLWVKDEKSDINGGEGVELWPRMVVTAKFNLEDMKVVKRALPNATINDVLMGILSYGFSKYLDIRSSHALQEGLQLTGLAMVNLRSQPGLQEMSKLMDGNSKVRWGNRFGMILLPIRCYTKEIDPLKYVKRAKVMVDKKKQSLEAHFSYNIGKLTMNVFGPKAARILNYRILCNTSFTISNVVGPQQELSFVGNPITCIRATSSALPHAVTMHMVSYSGKANMQILVAKEIIPDPRFLAKCFQDALLEMKDASIKVVS